MLFVINYLRQEAMVKLRGDKQEIPWSISDDFKDFSLPFDGQLLQLRHNAIQDGLKVGDMIVLVGEETPDGIIKLLEVN